MATWPASLPQHPKRRGYNESAEPSVIRSPNEIGPANQRRRYTEQIKIFPIGLIVTATQLETFETFFDTTIDAGATAFDWVHPRTRAAATCRIRSVPIYTPQGGQYWYIAFQMEILP